MKKKYINNYFSRKDEIILSIGKYDYRFFLIRDTKLGCLVIGACV